MIYPQQCRFVFPDNYNADMLIVQKLLKTKSMDLVLSFFQTELKSDNDNHPILKS